MWNIDENECFKWSLVRYLHPADRLLRKITNVTKDFTKSFKDIKFPVKIRDSHNIEKQSSISISIFGYQNKEKYPIYVSSKQNKRYWFIIDKRRRWKTIFSYQGFWFIYVWSYTSPRKKKFLLLLITSF